VHKPQCVELSIVAVGAYKNNIFRPKGFAAAMNEAQQRALIASKCSCQDKTKCPCGISQLRSQVQLAKKDEPNQQKITGEKNQLSEKPPKQEPPIEETDEEKAKKAAVKAGTELTYQQLQDELTKNTATIMNACKAAIAESSTNLEAKLATEVKAAVSAMLPKIAAKPTGKGIIAAPDDAQKLNNMFARKANLHKAGLELKAAAHRMAGLTADITHEEGEEA
jgi:predicted transcriptional regulator